MPVDNTQPWSFISPDGDFKLTNPHHTSYLYFPLVNEAGMMSVVTPDLHGDAKIGQHSFLLPPVSVEDLHTSRLNRNFWVVVDENNAWSTTGNSVKQVTADDDTVTLEAGFLWHKVTRENKVIGIKAETISCVPTSADYVELMKVKLSNIGNKAISILPTAAIPIYGRSADNLRDHRNVTSMLHRARCDRYGILVKPTLSFDERGHHPNDLTYAVLGAEGDGAAPAGFYPLMEDFVGEGGSWDWPGVVIHPNGEICQAGKTADGYETMGGIQFQPRQLSPGESCSYILILAILSNEDQPSRLVISYGTETQFDQHLEQVKNFWHSEIESLSFRTGDPQFDAWCKWVTLQPILRRLFGNSFLPYHDYGRGGRGWRDLWQDVLALLLMERGSVDHLLFGNFAGVRLDGSNATIIGNKPGEFKADRNNIPRVWMDHGAWPFLTSHLYIDQTGDLDFLLRLQCYFKDSHSNRCTGQDPDWNPLQGTVQRTRNGSVYYGTVLEHLLVQHLTAFFHVGEHNNILLEGADWNDGMDMARQRGEGVAFTSFYAHNLRQLSQLVVELKARGVLGVEIANELLPLLDTLNRPVNYESPAAKNARLVEYFATIQHTITGQKTRVSADQLSADLLSKAEWLTRHLRTNEWVHNSEGFGWFNGYYDNDSVMLEGDHPNGVRMTLTGQVFPMMGWVASDEQARQQVRSADKYLYAPELHGYRLNTDIGEVKLNMGRCFGYAYGHKENGAMFSHMAVMYAYALYARGFIREGYRVLDGIYRQSINFSVSRMYPGIPEYFNNRGRGMYPYLTGSASWFLLTMVTKVFGIYGKLGDLALEPKLVIEQFNTSGDAVISTMFAGRMLDITYKNPSLLEFGNYRIGRIVLDGSDISGSVSLGSITLPRIAITNLDDTRSHLLEVHLVPA